MAIDQTVGVQIETVASSTLSTLDALISKTSAFRTELTSLNRSFRTLTTLANKLETLRGIDLSNVNNQLRTLTTLTQNLNTASTGATALSRVVSSLKGLNNLDLTAVQSRIQSVANSLDPLITKLQSGESAFRSFVDFANSFRSTRITNEINKIGTATTKSSKSFFSFLGIFGKIRGLWSTFKANTKFFTDSVLKSFDFTETKNLYASALTDMVHEGERFINKMSSLFGVGSNELMKYQATFENMLGSLGNLSNKDTYDLSELLVQYALDYASLYNVDFDDAMTKYQAALSKQVRPIRSTSGFDITTATLQESLGRLGIDRTVASLTEMEKRLLIIYSLQSQMAHSGAMGDLAKTIEEPSNQLRVLKQQIQEVSMWFGNLFYNVLRDVLPVLNGFTMAIKEMIKAFALFVGYDNSIKEMKNPLSSYVGDSESVSDNMADAAETMKKMREYSLPFDELNAISKSSDSSSGSGGGGISGDLLEAIKGTDSIMNGITMKAIEIRNNMLEWLGYDFNMDEYGTLSDVVLKEKSRLELILNIVKAIGAGFVALKGFELGGIFVNFAKKIMGISNKIFGKEGLIAIIKPSINAIKVFVGGLSSTTIMVGAVIAVIVGALVTAYYKFDWFKEKVHETLKSIGDFFTSIYQGIVLPLIGPIVESLLRIYEEGIKPLWIAFSELVAVLAGVLLDLFNYLMPVIIDFIEFISPAIWFVSELFSSALEAVIILVSYLTTEGLKGLSDFITSVVAWFKDMWEKVEGFFNGFVEFLEFVFQKDLDNVFHAIAATIGLVVYGIIVVIEAGVNFIIDILNGLLDFVNSIGKAFGFKIETMGHVSWSGSFASLIGIQGFANGGFPEMGELFLARESGNELVGRIGSKSAVMNNDQLISSVALGVRDALVDAIGDSDESITVPVVIKLNDDTLYDSNVKVKKRRGMNFSKGGLII